MPAANVLLSDPCDERSTPIRERMARPNPWMELFGEPLDKSDGYTPCPQHPQERWINSVGVYKPEGDIEEIRKRRLAALEELADLLQQNAKDKGGSPEDWRVIVLSRWWMRETFAGGMAYIDCTYAIVPRGC